MKLPLSICLLFFSSLLFAQSSPAELAKDLTLGYKTDREKVKAIFKWITENISYQTRGSQNKKSSIKENEPEEQNDTDTLLELNERVAETVFKNKLAVCVGYSRLFKSLCDHSGIRCELITGYAKSNIDRPGARFGVNHYWNAVYFDSSWHLLDVTWASGYINWAGNEFIRQYDDHYFLTPPEEFIIDHYPDDLQWTLLSQSPIPREFRRSPFKQKSFIKYSITSYYPKVGEIEASIGDTLRLEIETADAERDNNICPDLLIDTTLFSRSDAWVFLKPLTIDKEYNVSNKIRYIYPVLSANIEWLYLMYNDDIILRYKINISKGKEIATVAN